jgi:hypothetical protein
MHEAKHRVLQVCKLRGLLTAVADVKGAVAFQNDVNALIAAVARMDTGQFSLILGGEDGEVRAPFGVLPPRPGDGPGRRRRQLTPTQRTPVLLDVR